jgi:hypothetical protein
MLTLAPDILLFVPLSIIHQYMGFSLARSAPNVVLQEILQDI